MVSVVLTAFTVMIALAGCGGGGGSDASDGFCSAMRDLRTAETDLAPTYVEFVDDRGYYEWRVELASTRVTQLEIAEAEAGGDLARALGDDYLLYDAREAAEGAQSQLDGFDTSTGTYLPGIPPVAPSYVNDPLQEDPYTIVGAALRNDCELEPWLTQEAIRAVATPFSPESCAVHSPDPCPPIAD